MPEPAVVIRPLDLRDDGVVEALHALGRASYAVEAELIGSTAMPALRETPGELRTRPLSWLGALSPDGELTGFVAWEDGADGHGHGNGGMVIDRLCVDPGRFRQGIASLLLGHLLAEVAAGRRVAVTTGAANAPAVALYERLGFTRGDDVEAEPGLWLASFTRPPRSHTDR
ncbi:GNAT family N-acetyltransferase [Streptomyces sp. NPDC089799]|uniref:GNAT family N-acetyltransferase n=1 Tax=Streptomyces sp. NPDC089799 TaxID=3155066 RepID=UPI003428308A